jgi:AcrR family transcriptional regulator
MRIMDPAKADHILEVAAQLFAKRHYHEVRMEDVALKAGVAKGTIYRYFEDKEDLYLGLILAGGERLFAEVESALAAVDDPEEKIAIYVERTIQFFREYPYFFDLVQRIEASTTTSRLEALWAARKKFFDLVASLTVELNATGRFVVTDPLLAALALTGMTRQVLRFYPAPWPGDLGSMIVHQFLDGLRAANNAIGAP